MQRTTSNCSKNIGFTHYNTPINKKSNFEEDNFMENMFGKDMIIEQMTLTSALRDRIVYLNDCVDKNSMFKCCYLLDRIVSLDKIKGNNDENLEPIEIIIRSEGGEIYSGNALLSKIKELRDKGYYVITKTDSIAASMAGMCLMVGSHRVASKYATIMLHVPSSMSWGDLQQLTNDVEETKRLWDLMKNIIIENTKITETKLEDIKTRRHDWFLSAEEALEYGIIDEII